MMWKKISTIELEPWSSIRIAMNGVLPATNECMVVRNNFNTCHIQKAQNSKGVNWCSSQKAEENELEPSLMIQLVELCRLNKCGASEFLPWLLLTSSIRKILVRLSATRTACNSEESQTKMNWRTIARDAESWKETETKVQPHWNKDNYHLKENFDK